MKKILVPVDFSDTSVNAAEYASQLCGTMNEAEIILYNVYDKISHSSNEDGEGSKKYIVIAELRELGQKFAGSDKLNVTYIAEEGSFVTNLQKYITANNIDLVVMGITGSSRLKQVFMGTNTLNVIRHINTPVMIIPPAAKYKGVKNVLLTSDFKEVEKTTPFAALISLLDLFKAKLNIVNVDSEHYVELTEDYKKERAVIEEKLAGYNPEFSFLRAFDFLNGINLFVETKNIDAIITVPKKHNFLSQLFVTSHTKKLAYHSHVPIIAIHS